MSLYLAITRNNVADYVYTFAVVYVVIIFVRILMSWFRLPYNRWLNAFLEFVTEVTDPYLRMWRRVLPMARIGPAALDLSPMVGSIVLLIVAGFVQRAIQG
jgi:YggT family protein